MSSLPLRLQHFLGLLL